VATILVIDDSPAIVTALTEILGGAGHSVDALDNFLDLPFRLRESPPDMVILDLSMPMMSGEMAAGYIKKYQEKAVPILLYSSRSESELVDAVRTTGAAGFLRKGCDPSVVIDKVEAILGARGGA
jgi:DNA-binding response OmpR family regulator